MNPCQWIVAHVAEIPVRCGDDHFAHVGSTPVCMDHLQTHLLDFAPAWTFGEEGPGLGQTVPGRHPTPTSLPVGSGGRLPQLGAPDHLKGL